MKVQAIDKAKSLVKYTKSFKITIIKLFFSFLLLFSVSTISFGQVPPPPPPPNGGPNNGHGMGGNQGAPGAPIGGGLEIFIILGVIYVGKQAYQLREAKEE
jgi:hypothetical protein